MQESSQTGQNCMLLLLEPAYIAKADCDLATVMFSYTVACSSRLYSTGYCKFEL